MSTLLHEFIRKSEEAICDSEEISRATSYDAMSKRPAVLAVESTGLAKSRHGSTEEADIEAAYWRFDARRKGYAQMSERDAFKAEMRLTVRSVRDECAEQCEQRANSLRDGSAIARQCAKDIRSRIK
jgi:transcription initiation factor IIE alpha subunit